MSTKALSCSCCGNLLTFPEDVAVIECPACGTPCAAPHATGDMLLTLQRAVEQRLACDFHSAELSYQQVLLFHPDEHEALWGRLLCHYGVEYVEDPVSRRRMPTVRTVHPKPLQEQADFRKACEFAPAAVRAQYEQDARYIDDAQAEIRRLAVSCASYDVFLCHKTTRPGSSDFTQDFHRATQLYHFLKDQGVRVFFAPECLQGAAGSNYEAGIYHALQTAKVMLLVCSQAEYLTSAWVRSEWTRFLDLVDEDPARQIVPLFYDHFSPSALPQPFIFRRIQGLDMTAITAPQTLLTLVAGAVGSAQQEAVDTPVSATVVPAEANLSKSGSAIPAQSTSAVPQSSESIELDLRKAFMELEEGFFDRASPYLDRVLDNDPENAHAHLGRLLIEQNARNVSALSASQTPFDDSPHYRRVMRYGDESLCAQLAAASASCSARHMQVQEDAFQERAGQIRTLLSDRQWETAAPLLSALEVDYPTRYEVHILRTLLTCELPDSASLADFPFDFTQLESWQHAVNTVPASAAEQLQQLANLSQAARQRLIVAPELSEKCLQEREISTIRHREIDNDKSLCLLLPLLAFSYYLFERRLQYIVHLQARSTSYSILLLVLSCLMILFLVYAGFIITKAYYHIRQHKFSLRFFSSTESTCHWNAQEGTEYSIHVDDTLACAPASPGTPIILPNDRKPHTITLSRIRMEPNGSGTLDTMDFLRICNGKAHPCRFPKHNATNVLIVLSCILIVTLVGLVMSITTWHANRENFLHSSLPVNIQYREADIGLSWPEFFIPGTEISPGNVEYVITRQDTADGPWQDVATTTDCSYADSRSILDPATTTYCVTVQLVGSFGIRTVLHTEYVPMP